MPSTGHQFCFLVVVYIHAMLWAWQVTVGIGLLITVNDLAFNNKSSSSKHNNRKSLD
jgi:hypothetical protein